MNNKKSINIIFPYNTVGGAFRSTYEISNRLTNLGYNVRIYFPFFPLMQEHKFFTLSGIMHFVRGFFRSLVRRNKVTWFDCEFEIKQIPFINKNFIRDADIIIANHWPVAMPVYKLPRSKGEKYYFIRDIEQWAPYYDQEVKAFNLDMKRLVVAEWIKEYLYKNLNLDVVDVITNGFNFQNFSIEEKVYKDDDLTISMIYSDHPMKGIKDGIVCLNNIKNKFPLVKILLFGFQPKPKNLKFDFEYIKGAKGEAVKEIYASTDIFLCPSIQEGFHNPPSEAMAAKCAVVATNVGSVPFTMKNMENGIIVEPQDIDAMGDSLSMLIEDKKLRISISEMAYKTIQDLTWEKSIHKLDNIFSS